MRLSNRSLPVVFVGCLTMALLASADPARQAPVLRSVARTKEKEAARTRQVVWSEGLPKEVKHNPDAPDLSRVYAEVNWGVAAKYPDDVGLERDKAVVFKVDFDNSGVPRRPRGVTLDEWCGVSWRDSTETSTEAPVSGRSCAANRWEATDTGGSASRWLLGTLRELHRKDEPMMLFMRLYHKFDAAWYGDGKILGLKGFGFVVQAVKHAPGLACDGKNWFSSEMQWVGWGPSAKTGIYKDICIHGHYYAYMPYPEQIMPMLHEDLRPDAYRFSAYANQPTWVHLDEWYCYEVALLMNTPGEADGEARYWENGKLVTHIRNMRYADTLEAFRVYATINNVRTQHDNARTPVTRYLDNVVVANRYIGPIKFTNKQLDAFVAQGIVVHTGDAQLTERMRRARDAKKGSDKTKNATSHPSKNRRKLVTGQESGAVAR